MAWSSTFDERYAGGYLSYSADSYDASNLLNSTFTLANGETAYGNLTDSYTTADQDVYSLGILSTGYYTLDVDSYTWDWFSYGYGSVSRFELLNSYGGVVDTSYSVYSDITFTVTTSDTYYAKIIGPSYSEEQYSIKYTKTGELLGDTTAPTLTSFSLPTTVDLASGEGELIISASAFDAGSGVEEVRVYFDQNVERAYSSGGSPSTYKLAGLYGFGDSWVDGSSREDWFLTKTNDLGTYKIDYVVVKDESGNERTYYASTLSSLGYNTEFELIDSSASTTYTIPSIGQSIFDHKGGDAIVNAPVNVSRNLYNAIYVDNEGTGSTILTANGTVRGAVGQTDQTSAADGIYVYNETTTKDLSITAKDVTGLDDGISAINKGSGLLSISVSGDVTSTSTDKSDDNNSHGIYASGYGTDVTILTDGDVTSNDRGVFAWNYGNGETSITSTGTVTAGYYRGIYVENDEISTASDITIKANNVNAFVDGIVAFNYGSGSTEITSTGTVKGGVGQTDQTANSGGIYVYNETTTKDLSITAKDVTGLDDGISATNNGSGVLSISVGGDVTSTSTDKSDDNYSYGIYASGYGTDVTILTDGDVTSNDRGIFAWNKGSGKTNITSKGTVTAGSDDGIYADNADWSSGSQTTSSATDIHITVNNVTAYDYGINAQSYGTGSTTITSTGTVKGGVGQNDQTANSGGIYVYNETTTKDLSITAKDVTGLDDGISATNKGSGLLSISVSGDVTSTSTDKSDDSYSYGIYASGYGTDVTVSTDGDVTSNDRGIFVWNFGSGSTTITSLGSIYASLNQNDESYNQAGIEAYNAGSATNIIISAKNVEALTHGIYTKNLGSGSTEISVSGNVIGRGSGAEGIHTAGSGANITVLATASVIGAAEGIETDSKADTVTVNGSVTGLNGTAILLGGGDDTVTLGAAAKITGKIDGGTGSDTANFSVAKSAVDSFTYDETTKIAVVTIDSKETSFKDFEYFTFANDLKDWNITELLASFNNSPTGNLRIVGSEKRGETLTVNTSNVIDVDGLGTFLYQWLRNGEIIAGETKATFQLSQADVGKIITVKASYTDLKGTFETITARGTRKIEAGNDAPTGSLVISGSAKEGETLSLDTSTIDDTDGLGAFNFTWLKDGEAISGATSSSYSLTQGDVGSVISASLSYIDGSGLTETMTAAATSAVENVNDAPSGSLTISGSAEKGSVLTLDSSSIGDEDGLGAFTTVWKSDGSVISGASDNTFTLTADQVGKAISAVISYTDGHGTAETVTSASTSSVKDVIVESVGAFSVTNSGTSASPILDFYLDASKDPGSDGVGSFDVVLSFDPIEASYDSFSFASGLIGNANETDASAGKITVGAIAFPNFTNLSTPLFTMNMTDLDTTADFAIYASGVSVDGTALDGSILIIENALTESTGAIYAVIKGTSSAPVLDFYLDKAKDPAGDGVTSIDVTLKFNPAHASFESFSYADGLIGAANEAGAEDGTITFAAIGLSPVSTDQPLFSMVMKDLDSTNDFGLTVTDLNIDGSALEGSTLLVGSPASHTVTTSVVTRDGSKISDADVVMSDGTYSSSYKSASDGSVSGSLTSGSASTVTASLAYSSSSKAISSQDALDTLKLSVGITTAAGTQTAFDFMSADFNQDGKVSSQDALSILQYSVGLPTSEEAKWVFVDTNGDYSGVSKSNTSYTEGVSIADLSADTSVSLTGILIGDVNDSYSGLIA